MAFRNLEDILIVDPRFLGICTQRDGAVCQMELADLHAEIARIQLSSSVPGEVRSVFDRARSTLLYAYFDYDLLVVGETQAFGAVEFALKQRLNGHGDATRGTLRNLVDRARKAGIFPLRTPKSHGMTDQIEALIELRNGLSHGTAAVHLPGMALDIVEICAQVINHIYSI